MTTKKVTTKAHMAQKPSSESARRQARLLYAIGAILFGATAVLQFSIGNSTLGWVNVAMSFVFFALTFVYKYSFNKKDSR